MGGIRIRVDVHSERLAWLQGPWQCPTSRRRTRVDSLTHQEFRTHLFASQFHVYSTVQQLCSTPIGELSSARSNLKDIYPRNFYGKARITQRLPNTEPSPYRKLQHAKEASHDTVPIPLFLHMAQLNRFGQKLLNCVTEIGDIQMLRKQEQETCRLPQASQNNS